MNNSISLNFERVMRQHPDAWAVLQGSEKYMGIYGTVRFYKTALGTLVVTEVRGLPDSDIPCERPIFAFHIHEQGLCTGTLDDQFADVGTHYNPYNCPHPHHAGDMPPLFSADGYAFSAFLTDRFTVDEVVGRAVIIHSSPDDFHTQPSGNSGKKIACGNIMGRKR